MVQRLFSAFPGGWPGVGLLLLRAAVGIAAASQGTRYLVDGQPELAVWAAGVVAIVSGALLIVGFLTPGAGAVVVLGGGLIALATVPVFSDDVAPDRLAAAFLAIVAASIVPLGPGAFSFDAYLFGRREIVIHQDARLPKHSDS
jgi:hypothetical protein